MTDFLLLSPLWTGVSQCRHTIFCHLCYHMRNSSRSAGWTYKGIEGVVLARWCLSKLIFTHLEFYHRICLPSLSSGGSAFIGPHFISCWRHFLLRSYLEMLNCKNLHGVFKKPLPPVVTLKGWILHWCNVMYLHPKDGFCEIPACPLLEDPLLKYMNNENMACPKWNQICLLIEAEMKTAIFSLF